MEENKYQKILRKIFKIFFGSILMFLGVAVAFAPFLLLILDGCQMTDLLFLYAACPAFMVSPLFFSYGFGRVFEDSEYYISNVVIGGNSLRMPVEDEKYFKRKGITGLVTCALNIFLVVISIITIVKTDIVVGVFGLVISLTVAIVSFLIGMSGLSEYEWLK